MKLHFDPEQEFQLDAINTIVGIFEGQPLNQGDFGFSMSFKSRDDIEFYFKLSFRFKIKTPIGNYNPDRALITENFAFYATIPL